MSQSDVNYEIMPVDAPRDETDINLRSYFTRMSDERLREYRPEWSDEEMMRWDDNFTSEGTLFITCCERDIDAPEYRRVLEEHLRFRGLA